MALFALLAVVLTGIIPAQDAFLGLTHSAVITVAAILIISYTLRESGLVDYLANFLNPLSRRPAMHVAALTGLAAASFGLFDYSPVAGLNQGTHTIPKGVTEVGLILEIGILAGEPN